MLKDWVRFGIILGSSVSHTSHPTPRGILCTVLRFSHFWPFSSAVTGNTVVFRLGYAVAAFWVSLFLSLSLTVCFQCSRRGDPCISKSNHVTSLLKLCGGCASLRLKSEVFTTARKGSDLGSWSDLISWPETPQSVHTRAFSPLEHVRQLSTSRSSPELLFLPEMLFPQTPAQIATFFESLLQSPLLGEVYPGTLFSTLPTPILRSCISYTPDPNLLSSLHDASHLVPYCIFFITFTVIASLCPAPAPPSPPPNK